MNLTLEQSHVTRLANVTFHSALPGCWGVGGGGIGHSFFKFESFKGRDVQEV